MSSSSASIIDTLFQRTLDDLIKALRHAHQTPAGEPPGILVSKAVEEIRREIKSTDTVTKSIALQKLCYLSSLHFQDMSWASFQAVECISSQNYSHKRAGYLSITQSFNDSTPVILLITNQLRKDLKSKNELEVTLALDCLSRIGTVDLCRDLTPEVFALMGSSKLVVRKKAVGVVLRIFERYPDAVKVCFMRLVEGLESSEPAMLSAVVGVFCELTCKEPKSYLPLAPEFYKVLVDSRNNWVLIKVLKIFTKLAPLEPRLAKRLVDPVCEIMRRSDAKSVVFECIRTVVSSLLDHNSAVKLAGEKIREFLLEDDPNLKYLGLQALSILARHHQSAVSDNKEIVIKSLSDADPNIKLESLHLLMTLVSDSNVAELCHALVNIALKSSPEFCNEILWSILSTCSQNVYALITDFDWYVSLLGEISRNSFCQRGDEIGFQLIDIAMRVRAVRPRLVRVGRDLLIDPALLGNPFLFNVLSAAAWTCGEYVELCRNPSEIMDALLQPRTNLLPPSVKAVYIQSAFKVLVFCLNSYLLRELDNNEMRPELGTVYSINERSDASSVSRVESSVRCQQEAEIFSGEDPKQQGSVSTSIVENGNLSSESISGMLNRVHNVLSSSFDWRDAEIQERMRNILGFVKFIVPEISNFLDLKTETFERSKLESLIKVVGFVNNAFSEEVGPVSTAAQERVLIPEGLTLLDNLSELDDICGPQQFPSLSTVTDRSCVEEATNDSISDLQRNDDSRPLSDSTSLLSEHRKRHELYYLLSETNYSHESDYPPANDHKMETEKNDCEDDTNYLVKLTDKPRKLRQKTRNVTTRPEVVKLEETDVFPAGVKDLTLKEDFLSTAVRDVLSASDKIFSQEIKSSSNECREKSSEEAHTGVGGSSSRTKQRDPSNGRRKGKSKKKSTSERVNDGGKEKQKRRHRHSEHKDLQADDDSSSVVVQRLPLPDLLL